MNEMEGISEIKIPKGVESISVTTQDDGKIVIEFIPEKAKFKEGDFVYEDGRIMIVKSYPCSYHANVLNMRPYNKPIYDGTYGLDFSEPTFRHATEEERQILIDAMKKDGKRWNADKLEIEYWLEPWSEEPKKGDLAIFWDNDDGDDAIIRLYDKKDHRYHRDSYGTYWENVIKFESKEQFEKVLRGEI